MKASLPIKWIAAAAVLLAAGCSTVTIRPEGGEKTSARPDYQKSEPYYFWGLAEQHTLDIGEICAGRGAAQLQSRYSLLDGTLGWITLGIYLPKTARIWCKAGGNPP